jgi:hypothetical protein
VRPHISVLTRMLNLNGEVVSFFSLILNPRWLPVALAWSAMIGNCDWFPMSDPKFWRLPRKLEECFMCAYPGVNTPWLALAELCLSTCTQRQTASRRLEIAQNTCTYHILISPVHDPLFMLYFSSFLSLHQQHAGHKFKLDLA